jgi:hypothetical protein
MTWRIWREGVPSAGLFTGAAAWMISTQLNYALAGWVCAAGAGWLVPVLAALLVASSLAGGFLSWLAWGNAAPAPIADSTVARPRRFLAGLGMLSAVLFALVIASQARRGSSCKDASDESSGPAAAVSAGPRFRA